eukprot:364500-Chlamydomonas_euryale.AAC.21
MTRRGGLACACYNYSCEVAEFIAQKTPSHGRVCAGFWCVARTHVARSTTPGGGAQRRIARDID